MDPGALGHCERLKRTKRALTEYGINMTNHADRLTERLPASNAASRHPPDAPSLPAATRGRPVRESFSAYQRLKCNEMTLRGGWVVEFVALAATSRGGVGCANGSPLWPIRPVELKSACHREDRALQECTPSARWSAIRQGPGDETRTRSYFFRPPAGRSQSEKLHHSTVAQRP